MNRHYDIIIVGGGLTGCLMALYLASQRESANFVLIEPGEICGGAELEAAILAEIPAALSTILDGFVVKDWDHCHAAYTGGSERHDTQIVMIDPLQLHLEMLRWLEPGELELSCEISLIEAGRVSTAHGEAYAKTIIDTRSIDAKLDLDLRIRTHNADFGRDHGLAAPILADFSLSRSDWVMQQYFPVDSTKMLVRMFANASARHDDIEQDNLRTADEITGLADKEAEIVTSGGRGERMDLALVPSRLQLAAKLAASLSEAPYLDAITINCLMDEIMAQAAIRNAGFRNFVERSGC